VNHDLFWLHQTGDCIAHAQDTPLSPRSDLVTSPYPALYTRSSSSPHHPTQQPCLRCHQKNPRKAATITKTRRTRRTRTTRTTKPTRETNNNTTNDPLHIPTKENNTTAQKPTMAQPKAVARPHPHFERNNVETNLRLCRTNFHPN